MVEKRYVALLRGVNVNGVKILSVDLAELFSALGFGSVKTVLASGNVRFDATDVADPAVLKATIEKALRERFGYDAWIVLVGLDDLQSIVDAFPFDAERSGWHPYVLFGSDDAVLAELLGLGAALDPSDDVIAAGEHVIYWHNRRDVGVDSPFSKIAGKARYRSTTTNRNLRTLLKLLA
ncbi:MULTISPECIES: DUF1697 domain-containing protein [unclassified Leifsonia]|uniref:DUF1697 domain-containing protein n=1 Tax=unclassified Leifsonia TaxID=2663824 RepID=UPI0006FE029D|nr:MULTISPECIES: DUF1697 domain-containing protein [unclassified Leifsonia]KQX06775.1 pyridoxamine 5-phosphate oxidase [Leifsonia sp. Root1293]KRA11060.1 pyridoxamine 5-phosphate oxidase [Leifsonia sp. Root60]